MHEQFTGPVQVYYARAMDRAGVANILADDRTVGNVLAQAGFEITNPFRTLLPEPVDALALVDANRQILARSSLMVANLAVPHYPYVGVWFEMAQAAALGVPVASWVGDSGYERHHYLNAYCEFIGEDVHGVVEYLRRARTYAGVAAQMEESKAYYDSIATRYDEMTSQCYPAGRGPLYHAERAGLADALVTWCRDRSVLELGCGNGEWTASILRSARAVRCVDASAAMIAEARARTALSAVAPEFLQCDFFDPDVRFSDVEVVVGFFLLGFLPRMAQQRLLCRIARECGPGTLVLLGESVRQSETPGWGLGSVRLQTREVDGQPFVICKEVFSASALSERARGAGLQIVEERQPAMWFSFCVAEVPR